MAELITRNAASAFSFGLVEIALYGFEDESMAIQPRVVAKTQIIERTIVVVRNGDAQGAMSVLEASDEDVSVSSAQPTIGRNELGESPKQAEYRAWWTPVLESPFDDPDQEPAKLFYPNHVRAALPWPRPTLAAYRAGGDTGELGVNLGGRDPGYSEAMSALATQRDEICADLPEGSVFSKFTTGNNYTFSVVRSAASFRNDDERRRWLSSTLNAYANVFRPRIKAMLHERRLEQA